MFLPELLLMLSVFAERVFIPSPAPPVSQFPIARTGLPSAPVWKLPPRMGGGER